MTSVDLRLFPWTLGEVRAALAVCPPRAFHVTGLRLERLRDGTWWGDLTAWRADTQAPLVWPGFRLRRAADGTARWHVTVPPYLRDLGGPWRTRLTEIFERVATDIVDDPAHAAVGMFQITFEKPREAPGPEPVGDDRITPGHTPTAIWLHHAKRYRFAAARAAGRRVLDLGCGVGYGSRMLARTARHVLAVDLAEPALRYAARAYRSPRVQVLAADARRLPLADRCLDLVVCFEMLEHLQDHAAVLDEIVRVLAPDGQLVISTPNPRFYAPDAHHVGLLAREAFARVLRERFAEVELWSQPRLAGLVEITEEFEPRPGADDDAEIFLAVAAAPRAPRPPRATVHDPAEPAPAPTAPPPGAAGQPRVLAFNWHEPYLALLARTGTAWSVATWQRAWNRAYRPVPAGVRLVDDPEEARTLVEGRGVDLVLCQTPADLDWLGDRPIPVVYLAHNSLANETRLAPPGTAEALRERVGRRLARHGGRFVAISDMKLASWGLEGRVVPPGVDPGECSGWTGEAAAALTVGNLLAERDHMLGYSALAAALAGLPWRILGTNPALGVREAPDWDALRAAYRTHRCYAHATRWPWEDGWNLALLEAMATGMPVVAWAHPTSPIRPGLEGFLADDADELRRWVRRLLDDPELAARLGARARARALACFPLDAFVARWQTVLAEAADPARRAWPGRAPVEPTVEPGGEAADPTAETAPVAAAATAPAAVGLPARSVDLPASPDEAALPAYYRHERPEVVALVPPTARRVLDVGCGAGGLGRALKRRGPCHVVGIEAHPPAAAAARQHLDAVLQADLDHLDTLPWAPGSFDCIVCADVLEHLREPARLLARLRPLLAPHGVLVASLPNVRHASVLLPLLVDGRWRYQDEGILDRTHLRFFTRAELDALLGEAGFRLTSLGATVTPEHPLTARLAALVAEAGGDPARFRDEARVLQYLLTAVPAPAPAPEPPRETAAAPTETAPQGAPATAAPGAASPAPAVSVVIPVFDQAALTRRCLAALARTVDPAEVEVVVVDNGSTDDTPALLAAPPLPVRALRNAANLGFARAANQGARRARGDLLVFLNNDTEPEPGWLDALRAAAADPTVGIVGAKLLYPGTRRLQHAGLALTPQGVPDHLWRHAPEDDPRAAQPRDLDMVTGACLAIRRDLFLALGGFDEGYQNGCEDVDLCLAVRARGLRVRYEPRAVVLHHEGATAGRFAHVAQNLARLHAKWGPQLAALPRLPAEEFGTLPGPPIAWEGSFFVHHSLAGINRAVCRELLARGIDLTLTPYEPDEFDPAATPETAALARLVDRPTKIPPVLRVRHRFPPDFTRRPGERLVLIQPWEFGAVPAAWVRRIVEQVDELWVPSEWVRQSFVAGGVPPERVVTIPNGFDPAVFRPDAPPLPLPTSKTFRFLYVGGSIHRKGYDLLLRAYVETFTAADDVCLVIKDHAYYRHRLDATLEELRRPGAPEVLYYFDNVAPAQMAGFYAAATCLVHPFRGEGFGLPILEAMACGRAVIVTDAGPVREFCPPDVGIFVPARRTPFPECRVDHLETVGRPFLVEPDLDALRAALRWAYEHREECLERGTRGAAHAHAHYPWPVIAGRYAARIEALLAGSTSPEPERLLAGAARLLEAGRVREALPRFAAAIRLDPECVPALVGAAHCALSLDEPAAARALLTRILALDPDNAPARAALAQLDAGARGGTGPRGPDPAAGAATPQAGGAR